MMPIKTLKKHAKVALLISSLLLLSACASSGPKPFKIQGEAEPALNRDSSGRPLSLVLRLYQLKGLEEFNRLTFDSLASGKTDAELLGSSLVAQNEFVLLPGKTVTLDDKIAEETKFIGVVGFFRKPDSQFWRVLVSAEDVRSEKEFSFKAQDCYLQVVHPKALLVPGQSASFKADCGFASRKPAPRTK
ncbi:type VI secretion system lipoprotein TssJ [Iodobacter ciconiae]|uniref:Type VI secretion system lipoprotein TssJ n=1 Tax=Iodobacter ciconiae TaxID=2496266 RepID=A0A3S8ZPD4_9NEIS|nr:type VI secretion system lipoprotein TssJ [Iodobacter ciconiae]AZN35331.1 type VI secretion system lipoprotein TssJ [Iodobacter ciconiae]